MFTPDVFFSSIIPGPLKEIKAANFRKGKQIIIDGEIKTIEIIYKIGFWVELRLHGEERFRVFHCEDSVKTI